MNDNEIRTIEQDITDLTARPQSGGLLDANTDNILYLAEKRSLRAVTLSPVIRSSARRTRSRHGRNTV